MGGRNPSHFFYIFFRKENKMSFENKKFLDIIGISHLWGKIKE
jgi:hypothetical protein